MSAKTFRDDRFTMLMACASPGSALAYHMGLAHFEPDVLRRDKATLEDKAGQPDQAAKAGDAGEALTDLVASGRVVALP